MVKVEVEFVYKITGCSPEQWQQLQAAVDYVTAHNENFSHAEILPPGEQDTFGYAVMRSTGHDKSAIMRRIVRPIRAVFIRAQIPIANVQLVSNSILPTGRNLTADEGRTPKGTFTSPMLRDMLADHGATLGSAAE